jgi:hypothetical protein
MGGMQPNPAGLGTSADTSPASRFGVLREEGIRAGIDANRRLYSRRTRPFIPAGLSLYSRRAVLLFPQSCPFIPAELSFYSRRAGAAAPGASLGYGTGGKSAP